jgi:hypothetical protein
MNLSVEEVGIDCPVGILIDPDPTGDSGHR